MCVARVEHLPSTQEDLGLILAPQKADVVVYTVILARSGLAGNGEEWSRQAQVVCVMFAVQLHVCMSMSRDQRLTLAVLLSLFSI